MAIVVDDPDLERALKALAAERGARMEDALRRVLRPTAPDPEEPAETDAQRATRIARAQHLISRIYARIGHDTRSAEEILGYDNHGLPR